MDGELLLGILCLIAIIIGGFLFIQSIVNQYFDYQRDIKNPECVRTELVAINLGQKIEGSLKGNFFLIFGGVSGSVSEPFIYKFYKKNQDGSYVLDQRNGSVPIFEDEEKNPYLKDCGKYETKSEFHIPKGSIISNYQLAL